MAGFEKYKDYDPELERVVLGVFLLEPATFGMVYGMLTDECFYTPHHEIAFKLIKDVFKEGLPVDLVTVTRKAYDNGMTEINHENAGYYFTSLTFGVVQSASLEPWCLMLRELAAKRELIKITQSGMGSYDDVLEGAIDIEKRLKKVLDIRTTDDWNHISKVALKLQKHMSDVEGVKEIGIPTGIATLDRLNGGFRPTQLIILGARPAVGKSAYMGLMATCDAFAGYSVGIISLEMDDKDILGRMTSADSRTPYYKIDRSELVENGQRKAVYDSMTKLAALPIYFSDNAQVNIHDIRAKAEKLKRKHGLDILFIDYLQLVEPENEKNRNREQEVSKISRGLKLLAMTMRIPIVVLAQLNREAAKGKPELHHLRESGSLEQDADIVMFLHRDTLPNDDSALANDAELLVRKWRNGTPVAIKLGFEAETMRFYEPGVEVFANTTKFDQMRTENPRAGIPTRYPTESRESKTDEQAPF